MSDDLEREPSQGEGDAAASLADSLRNVHRAVLFTLAVCAILILNEPAAENVTPPREAAAAIVLAIATIFMRALGNSPVMAPKRRVFFALGSLLCAGAIGILGVAVAMSQGARQVGLGFALGAAILVIRPPAAPASPPSRGDDSV